MRPSQVVRRFTVFWGGMPEPQLFLTSEDLVKQNFGFVCRKNGFNFFVKKMSNTRLSSMTAHRNDRGMEVLT